MLTQKVAYQIASGLAYLHKKNIIFCDLKSDNILVWSLDVKETVNIKLSDYGISRQSFHEGALGVEGTPGYQAPEIRPRIVYDEKVPMWPTAGPGPARPHGREPRPHTRPASQSWRHCSSPTTHTHTHTSFPLPCSTERLWL